MAKKIHLPRIVYKPPTWGQIKSWIEAKGIVDSDIIIMIDLGPDTSEIFIDRDDGGVEIADHKDGVGRGAE